jgi:hypothetical protein
MGSPLPGFTERALNRWVFLRDEEAAALALSPDRRPKVLALHRAGDLRADAAMGEPAVAALILARAAIDCHLEAVVVAHSLPGDSAESPPGGLWAQYGRNVAEGRTRPLPASLEEARQRAIAPAQTPDEEIAVAGEARIEEALALAAFLAGSVEVRPAGHVRLLRALRTVGLAAVVLLFLAEAVIHRPVSHDLALHAAATSSSRRPGAGAPSDLTNGLTKAGVAFSTKDEADPWVALDLGSVKDVSTVTLRDGDDHQDDGLPLRVETSAEGLRWEPAGAQASHFAPASPAVLSFKARPARFVRIHGRAGGAIYLNEVEVH